LGIIPSSQVYLPAVVNADCLSGTHAMTSKELTSHLSLFSAWTQLRMTWPSSSSILPEARWIW
jgi:hypothetical protein